MYGRTEDVRVFQREVLHSLDNGKFRVLIGGQTKEHLRRHDDGAADDSYSSCSSRVRRQEEMFCEYNQGLDVGLRWNEMLVWIRRRDNVGQTS
jgi:hypothetical protein